MWRSLVMLLLSVAVFAQTRTFTPTLRQNSANPLTIAQVDGNFSGTANIANSATRTYFASSQAAMLALSPVPQAGDWCWRTDTSFPFMFKGGDATNLANWSSIPTYPSIPVSSVFGRTGAVTAQSGDYSVGQVTDAASSVTLAASSGASTVGFLQAGASAVARTVQDKGRDVINVRDFGIVADGVTDQTTALTTLFSEHSSDRAIWVIPVNTKFTVATVYNACPVGITLRDESEINWGQPPTYKNKFLSLYSKDSVSDDSASVVASGHHPALMLLNMRNSGTTSAGLGRATLQQGLGRDPFGDPLLGWLQQFYASGTTSSDKLLTSWRLQTPWAIIVNFAGQWQTAKVYAAGTYVVNSSGVVYNTVAGGTSGASEPVHLSGTVSDGGVSWTYVQSALSLDSTRMQLDEDGNLNVYGPGEAYIGVTGGSRKISMHSDPTSHDVWLRDEARSQDVWRYSDSNGLQLALGSIKFASLSGATPTQNAPGQYINNGGATTMTSLTLPTGQTSGRVTMLFANGNTTLQHGTGTNNFYLKGAVNVTPPVSGVMEFVKYSAHSGAWIEMSRSF